jgi:hypothetical protein
MVMKLCVPAARLCAVIISFVWPVPGRQDRGLACIILGSGQATRYCSGRFGLVRPMPDMFQSADLSLQICPGVFSEVAFKGPGLRIAHWKKDKARRAN